MPDTKKSLRAAVRLKKQQLTSEDISRRSRMLCDMVHNTEAYRQSKTIYAYLPFNQEVNLAPLLDQALVEGKQVALPKCYGKEMRFVLISDLSKIRHTAFGVPEPVADNPIAADKTGLVLVPGLVFDRQGFRIGYGGGYYDRFLWQEPDHPTIGLCYDFQMTDHIIPESHDIPVDTVFSV